MQIDGVSVSEENLLAQVLGSEGPGRALPAGPSYALPRPAEALSGPARLSRAFSDPARDRQGHPSEDLGFTHLRLSHVAGVPCFHPAGA